MFVVDSRASVHVVRRKDLNSTELETVRILKSSTTVVTANGEVLTKEEATVHVRELEIFVTDMLLEDTPAVLSLGKLCEDPGYNYHWTSGQKPHLINKCRKINYNTANYVPFVVPGLSTSSSSSSSPTSPTSSSQDTVITTEYPASTRSENMSEEKYEETRRMDQQETKTQTKMTTTRKYKETRRMICQNGWRSSSTVW